MNDCTPFSSWVVSKSKDTSFLKAIHNCHNTGNECGVGCFKDQRYKFFESNSQPIVATGPTKQRLFQRAKIQVFWKQFTTVEDLSSRLKWLFQRAKIQVFWKQFTTWNWWWLHRWWVVSKSKDTSFLKAIHNCYHVGNLRLRGCFKEQTLDLQRDCLRTRNVRAKIVNLREIQIESQ